MTIGETGILVGIAALLILGPRLLLRRHNNAAEDPVTDSIDRAQDELREKYRGGIADGNVTVKVARVYSQMDLAMLKSLLDARGIPSDLLFGAMNSLQAGLGVPGYNDAVVSVLERDAHAAREVVADYVESLVKGAEAPAAGTVVRNIAELVVGETFVNPGARRPEVL
jgi:hypothetical protein